MKNPIQQIKHMWKDPINNVAEADARKKEVMPWLIGSAAVAAVFCILDGILGTGFLMIPGFVGICGVMLFGFMLFIIGKAKEKFKALTCDKCNTMAVIKTPAEMEQYVSYVVGTNQAVYHGVSHPASNDGVVSKIEAKASADVVVAINLKCPHCGNVKPLEYSITPFKCHASETKVRVKDVEFVKARLEDKVRAAVNDYNDPETRKNIPYSIHSKYNPHNAEKAKLQANDKKVHPDYNGVIIDYRKEPVEMVEQFFLENQLDGKIK